MCSFSDIRQADDHTPTVTRLVEGPYEMSFKGSDLDGREIDLFVTVPWHLWEQFKENVNNA